MKIRPEDAFTIQWSCNWFSTNNINEFSFYGKNIIDNMEQERFVLPTGLKCLFNAVKNGNGEYLLETIEIDNVFLPPLLQRNMKRIFQRVLNVFIPEDLHFGVTWVPLEVVNRYTKVINRILMEFQPLKYAPDAPLVNFFEFRPNRLNNGSTLWRTKSLYNVNLVEAFTQDITRLDFKLDLSSSLKEMAYKAIQDRILFLLKVPFFYLSPEEKAELDTLYNQLRTISLNPGINMDCEICQIKFATHRDQRFRPVCKDCGEQE